MCRFVSYIEQGKTKQILFLTTPLIESEKGKKLLAGLPVDDLVGHGAIRKFFGLEQDEGTNKECADFSDPKNFPTVIALAIKRGEMKGLATPQELLCDAVDAKWKLERETIYAKWRAEWDAIDAKFWDLFAIPENRNPLWR